MDLILVATIRPGKYFAYGILCSDVFHQNAKIVFVKSGCIPIHFNCIIPSSPAFSAQSAQIAKSISKSDRSSIASINVSSMISMPSFAPSASKSHDKGAPLGAQAIRTFPVAS